MASEVLYSAYLKLYLRINYEICLVKVLKQTLRGVFYETHTETDLATWGKNVFTAYAGATRKYGNNYNNSISRIDIMGYYC